MKHIGKTIASICVVGSLLLLIYQCDSHTSITYEELDRPETRIDFDLWMHDGDTLILDSVKAFGAIIYGDSIFKRGDTILVHNKGESPKMAYPYHDEYEPIHEPRFPNQSSPTL